MGGSDAGTPCTLYIRVHMYIMHNIVCMYILLLYVAWMYSKEFCFYLVLPRR